MFPVCFNSVAIFFRVISANGPKTATSSFRCQQTEFFCCHFLLNKRKQCNTQKYFHLDHTVRAHTLLICRRLFCRWPPSQCTVVGRRRARNLTIRHHHTTKSMRACIFREHAWLPPAASLCGLLCWRVWLADPPIACPTAKVRRSASSADWATRKSPVAHGVWWWGGGASSFAHGGFVVVHHEVSFCLYCFHSSAPKNRQTHGCITSTGC